MNLNFFNDFFFLRLLWAVHLLCEYLVILLLKCTQKKKHESEAAFISLCWCSSKWNRILRRGWGFLFCASFPHCKLTVRVALLRISSNWRQHRNTANPNMEGNGQITHTKSIIFKWINLAQIHFHFRVHFYIHFNHVR